MDVSVASGRSSLLAPLTPPPDLSVSQALKYECYLDSSLARFLLRRAIGDIRIAHYLFW